MAGRVVLVTGASDGIGRACCERLSFEGWAVVGASRRGTGGSGWEGVVMDVDDDEAVASGTAAVLAAHGRLDAVVACAGFGLAGAVEDTPLSEARAQFETNFWGAVKVVAAALPALRQAAGRIVLLSSIAGVVGLPFQAFYAASKFALEGYGESLAYEVGPFGVHVTLVEPGNVATGFTAARQLSAGGPDSPYGAARDRALGIMVRDEERGADPAQVASAVSRVLGARRPPRRITAGPAFERIGPTAKRLLPHAVFERAAKGRLGV